MSHIVLCAPMESQFDQLLELHRLAMGDYIAATWGPWDDEQQREFFRDRRAGGLLQVIEIDGVAVGLWEVRRGDGAFEVVNVEVHPDYQRRGISTRLIEAFIIEAGDRPVELQVLKVNPARRLYERLGFEQHTETDTHYLMRRQPRDRIAHESKRISG